MTSEVAAVESRLPEYELVVIVSPEGGEEALEARVEAVSKLITDRGGAVVSVKHWGKRKLAYPIKHSREGNYFLVNFKSGAQLGKELEASLRITEDVLRHLLVRLEISKSSS
ncbi:MAG: 30S ribosomal protein S6 [Dehalococcoidales bacterium]|jgi:small subunit ribosomal protein S6